MSFGAGIGAAYRVMVDFGIRNTMAPGMRSVQMQMAGLQTHLARTRKMTEEQAVAARRYAPIYQQIYGNPRTYKETRDNMDRLAAHKKRLESRLAQSTDPAEQARLASRVSALNAVNSDLQARGRIFNISRRQNAEDARAAKLAARERSAQILHRKKILTTMSTAGFKTMEYAGMGGLGILGGLGYASIQAAKQQQLSANTAIALGFGGAQIPEVANRLAQQAEKASMAVGMLSSADVSAVQTLLAQHLTARGPGGLKMLDALTLPVAKFADVMKLTMGVPVSESASVGAMAVNMFGARTPKQVMGILNDFYKMEMSTGAPMSRATTAMSYFARMGKMMGFSSQSMFDLYGESYRLGIGGGKSGQRIGAALRGVSNLPTSVVTSYFANMLGGAHGLLSKFTDSKGHAHLVTMLEYFKAQRDALVKSEGLTRGRQDFIQAVTKYLGAAGGQLMFNLATGGAIHGIQAQRKRELMMQSVQQTQATLFKMPLMQWQRFLTNFRTLVIKFGTFGLPLLGAAAKYAADHIQSWAYWMDTHKQFMGKLFKGLAEFGALLLGIAALGALVATAAKAIQAFTWVVKAWKVVDKIAQAMQLYGAGQIEASDVALAAANEKAALTIGTSATGLGASLLATTKKMAMLSGVLVLVAAVYEFLRGLGIDAKMQKTHPAWAGSLIPGETAFASNYAFPGAYGLSTGVSVSPRYTSEFPAHQTEVNVYIGGKKITPDLVRVLNKALRGGMHSQPSSGSSSVLMTNLERGGVFVPGGVR